jgi:hypothetical protein
MSSASDDSAVEVSLPLIWSHEVMQLQFKAYARKNEQTKYKREKQRNFVYPSHWLSISNDFLFTIGNGYYLPCAS